MDNINKNEKSINDMYMERLNNNKIYEQNLEGTRIKKEARLIIDMLSDSEYMKAIKEYLINNGNLILFMPNANVFLLDDHIRPIVDYYKNHEGVLVRVITQEIENIKYHFIYFQTQYFAVNNPKFIDECIENNKNIDTKRLHDIFSTIYPPFSIYIFPLIDFDNNRNKDIFDVRNIIKTEQNNLFEIKRIFSKTKSVKKILTELINHDDTMSYDVLYEHFLLNLLLFDKNIRPMEISKFKSIPPEIRACLPKYAIMNYWYECIYVNKNKMLIEMSTKGLLVNIN